MSVPLGRDNRSSTDLVTDQQPALNTAVANTQNPQSITSAWFSLRRQHAQVPAGLVRLGDVAACRHDAASPWELGTVLEIGIYDHRVKYNWIDVLLPCGKRLFDATARSLDDPDNTLVLFPPMNELQVTDPHGSLRQFTESTGLRIARERGDKDEPSYVLVDPAHNFKVLSRLRPMNERGKINWVATTTVVGPNHPVGISPEAIINGQASAKTTAPSPLVQSSVAPLTTPKRRSVGQQPIRYDAEVDRAIESYVIVLDTCFAMQDSFGSFLENYKDTLARNHILVPYKVVQELERICNKNDDRHHAAQSALDLLQDATRTSLAEYRRDPVDDQVINDAVISRVVEQILPRRNVLVLTHDSNLTSYLFGKTQQQCFSVKNLLVAGVNRDGRLFRWEGNSGNGMNGQHAVERARRPRQYSGGYSGPKPFVLSSTLAPTLGHTLAAKQVLSTDDTVFFHDRTQIRLGQVLASGGEGTIYELEDQSLLCKIYHPNKLTVDRQEKIELMLSRDVRDLAICWPRAAIYDSDGVFRGFTMPRAPGKPVPLGHSLFIPATFCKTRPNWTRRESTMLAITIVQKIKYLHDMNVLIGDINPLNILMNDEKNVYFVDCDSLQVEGYPCPVGTVNFTAPEIQGSDFRHFLRSKDHELFSVATLLFMIFMPGKLPYSHQGGEDGAANIKQMHFPYALQERKSASAPEGPWRTCWSHLTLKMRQEFNHCFHEENRNQPRTTVERWLTVLDWYAYEIGKNENVFLGPKRCVGYDLAILPQNMRRVEKDGEVTPPWPNDTLTDRERMVCRLASEANRASSPSQLGGYLSNPTGVPTSLPWSGSYTSRTPPLGPAATAIFTTTGGYTNVPTPSNPANSIVQSQMKTAATIAQRCITRFKGLSSGWKWAIAITSMVSVAVIAAAIWHFWSPILDFLKLLLFWTTYVGGLVVTFRAACVGKNNIGFWGTYLGGLVAAIVTICVADMADTPILFLIILITGGIAAVIAKARF